MRMTTNDNPIIECTGSQRESATSRYTNISAYVVAIIATSLPIASENSSESERANCFAPSTGEVTAFAMLSATMQTVTTTAVTVPIPHRLAASSVRRAAFNSSSRTAHVTMSATPKRVILTVATVSVRPEVSLAVHALLPMTASATSLRCAKRAQTKVTAGVPASRSHHNLR